MKNLSKIGQAFYMKCVESSLILQRFGLHEIKRLGSYTVCTYFSFLLCVSDLGSVVRAAVGRVEEEVGRSQ